MPNEDFGDVKELSSHYHAALGKARLDSTSFSNPLFMLSTPQAITAVSRFYMTLHVISARAYIVIRAHNDRAGYALKDLLRRAFLSHPRTTFRIDDFEKFSVDHASDSLVEDTASDQDDTASHNTPQEDSHLSQNLAKSRTAPFPFSVNLEFLPLIRTMASTNISLSNADYLTQSAEQSCHNIAYVGGEIKQYNARSGDTIGMPAVHVGHYTYHVALLDLNQFRGLMLYSDLLNTRHSPGTSRFSDSPDEANRILNRRNCKFEAVVTVPVRPGLLDAHSWHLPAYNNDP
ncbi:hypothetical protein KM043_009680 [Ampulex compressa]|nr:hypothetical protein KM043_009680 [Ampulex compressa]